MNEEDKKDLENSIGEEKIDWSKCVPNEYFILYKKPELPEDMDKIRTTLKEKEFQIIEESKLVPRIHTNYQGELKPHEVIKLDLSKYNITKIEPVPMVEAYDKQATLEK